MSQAKVEQHKKDKANRKKIMAKERAQRIAARVCAAADTEVFSLVCFIQFLPFLNYIITGLFYNKNRLSEFHNSNPEFQFQKSKNK